MTDIDNTMDGHEFDSDDPDFEAVLGSELAEADSEPIEGAKLTDALAAAIRKAVAVQVAEAAKEAADGVIADALTDDVVLRMRDTAVTEAKAAIDPEYKEPEPEPRKLWYPTLPEFVEKYLAHVYRREVSVRGSEKTKRWCPRWWDHGEVVARFEALWTGFETLRLGAGPEMAMWWTQYADPIMDRVLDPEGPFKYCSVLGGHRAELPALPTAAPLEGLFEDGHAYDPDHQPTPAAPTSSRLILPAAPTGNRRVVYWSFP